jgi:hypothetical protein
MPPPVPQAQPCRQTQRGRGFRVSRGGTSWRILCQKGGSPNELPGQPQWLIQRISAKRAVSVCQTSAISADAPGLLPLVASHSEAWLCSDVP